MNTILAFLFLSIALPASAQLECPNLDFCFPPTPGQNFDVPSAQYPTIESAVIAAPHGANIRIKAGTYSAHIIVGKNLNFMGNHTKNRPTVIKGLDLTTPIFSVFGNPTVKFKKLTLSDAAAAVKTEFFHNGPWANISLNEVTVANTERGVAGSYDKVEIERSDLIGGAGNGLALSRILKLELKTVVLQNYGGYGILVLGQPSTEIGIFNSVLNNNTLGGLMIQGRTKGNMLTKINADRNGVAAIILDHTGPTFIDNSVLANSKTHGGKFGHGLLNFSSFVNVFKTHFFENVSFPTALVGCATPASEGFTAQFAHSGFFATSTTKRPAFALYTYPGCADAPGTLKDDGGNSCSGAIYCGTESSGGLTPIPPKL